MKKDQQKTNMRRILVAISNTNLKQKDILPVIDLYDNEGNFVPVGGMSYAVLDDLVVVSDLQNDEVFYITKDKRSGEYNIRTIKKHLDENEQEHLQVSELNLDNDRMELNFRTNEVPSENKAYESIKKKHEFSQRAIDSYINGDIKDMTKGQFFNLSSANTIEEYIVKVDLLTTTQVANQTNRSNK